MLPEGFFFSTVRALRLVAADSSRNFPPPKENISFGTQGRNYWWHFHVDFSLREVVWSISNVALASTSTLLDPVTELD